MNRFHEKNAGGGASKQAVQQYLRSQQKEQAPQKSAFQLALEKAQKKD